MSNTGEQLAERIGYEFRDPALLERSLTHRSHKHDRRPNALAAISDNEQLEFLGDSILGFVVSEALVSAHPGFSEGQLSRRKAHLVSASHLYHCALELGIGEALLLGRGEERNGGRERRTLLANALEALIAAIHLDGGIEPARRFIRDHVIADRHLGEQLDQHDASDYKSLLQEQAQARGLAVPRYSIVETAGPEHAKVFTVEARIGDLYAERATGSSKKIASQQAAQRLVELLRTTDWQAAQLRA